MALVSAESTGQGASLARFKIVEEYLYAVDSHSFNIYNISNLENPIELSDIYAGFDIETIFNKGNYLFLGSNVLFLLIYFLLYIASSKREHKYR